MLTTVNLMIISSLGYFVYNNVLKRQSSPKAAKYSEKYFTVIEVVV